MRWCSILLLNKIRGLKRRLHHLGIYLRESIENLRYSQEPILDELNIRELQEYRKIIEPYHENYIRDFTHPGYAFSLESSALLFWVIARNKPEKILDLGSGFTSFVIRFAKQQLQLNSVCTSIDLEENWLDKTKEFLNLHAIQHDCLELFSMSDVNLNASYNLIVSDSSGDRTSILETYLPNLAENGIVILDDMHSHRLRKEAREVGIKFGLKYRSLYKFTIDDFGRFAAVLINPKSPYR